MNSNIYKQGEALGMSFMQIPYALFVNKKYKSMSADAKLAYGLLLRRMQLSNMKGWVNEDNEIYVIYTREQMAAELSVSYKKAVSSFQELTKFGLIIEKRRGRGLANYIFIAKVEIPEEDASEYTGNLRTVEFTHQDDTAAPGPNDEEPLPDDEPDIEFTEPCEVMPIQDLSNLQIKTCQTDSSRPDDSTHQDMSFLHTSNKDFSDLNFSDIEFSQSVCQRKNRQTPVDNSDDLDEIISKCELTAFKPEVASVFKNTIERMYYSSQIKVGDAIFPQQKVRSYLWLLDYYKVDLAYHKIRQNMSDIKNATAYITSVLFNCICEEEGEFMLDPFLNYSASYADT